MRITLVATDLTQLPKTKNKLTFCIAKLEQLYNVVTYALQRIMELLCATRYANI